MLPEILKGNSLSEQVLCLPPGAFARLGKGGITDAAISPDGNLLAVASHIGVWLYNAHTGDFSSLIAVESTGIVSAVAFSTESTQLAVGDWDGRITLWDIKSQEKFDTLNAKKHVRSIAFSPDGKYMAASFQHGGVILWNLDTWKVHLTLCVDMAVSAIAFSPDSQIFATVSREVSTLFDGEDIAVMMDRIQQGEMIVALWDVAIGELRKCYPSKQIESITFTLSGQLLAANSRGKEINVWQIDTGKNVTNFSLPEHVHFMGYSVDSRLLWLSGDIFTIWTDAVRSDILLNQPKHPEGWLVAFTSGHKHLASLNRSGTLRHWDVRNAQKIRMLKKVATPRGYDNGFRSSMLIYSSEASYPVTSILKIDGETVVLQNEEARATFTPEVTRPAAVVISASVSPDFTLLATGSLDRTVTLWDVMTEKPIQVMTGHTGEVYDLAFSPDGKQLVSGGARAWEYHEDEDGSTVRSKGQYMFMVEDGKSYYFYFHEDGHMDTTVKVWEVTTGKCITTLENDGWVNRIAFSGDGTRLVTSSAKYVNLWCTKTWEKLATFDTVKIESLTLSLDGNLLAIGGTWPEQRIQIWNIITQTLIVEFSGHKSDVESVTFSPNSTLLASASFDGTILLWDMKPYLQNETP